MPINALEVCWVAAPALDFALAVFRVEAATSVMAVDVFLRLAATFAAKSVASLDIFAVAALPGY